MQLQSSQCGPRLLEQGFQHLSWHLAWMLQQRFKGTRVGYLQRILWRRINIWLHPCSLPVRAGQRVDRAPGGNKRLDMRVNPEGLHRMRSPCRGASDEGGPLQMPEIIRKLFSG